MESHNTNRLNEIQGYHFQVEDNSFYALLSVLETGTALLKDIEDFLTSFDISHGRFSILLTLYKYQGDGVRPSLIARDLKKKKPTITNLVKRLLNDELVLEEPNQEDHRKKEIRLSAKGFKLLEKIVPVYNERIKAMAADLSEKDKEQLKKLMAKIRI